MENTLKVGDYATQSEMLKLSVGFDKFGEKKEDWLQAYAGSCQGRDLAYEFMRITKNEPYRFMGARIMGSGIFNLKPELFRTVYIGSPYHAETEKGREFNKLFARACCREAIKDGYLPIAPHAYFTEFLNDDREEERILGTEIGKMMIKRCDLVKIYAILPEEEMEGTETKLGETGTLTAVASDGITKGMRAEIDYATSLGKKPEIFRYTRREAEKLAAGLIATMHSDGTNYKYEV